MWFKRNHAVHRACHIGRVETDEGTDIYSEAFAIAVEDGPHVGIEKFPAREDRLDPIGHVKHKHAERSAIRRNQMRLPAYARSRMHHPICILSTSRHPPHRP